MHFRYLFLGMHGAWRTVSSSMLQDMNHNCESWQRHIRWRDIADYNRYGKKCQIHTKMKITNIISNKKIALNDDAGGHSIHEWKKSSNLEYELKRKNMNMNSKRLIPIYFDSFFLIPVFFKKKFSTQLWAYCEYTSIVVVVLEHKSKNFPLGLAFL